MLQFNSKGLPFLMQCTASLLRSSYPYGYEKYAPIIDLNPSL